MDSTSPIIINELAATFLQFFQCAVHCYIHSRKLYPEEVFSKCKKFGINVWQSKHPDINSYITSVTDNAIELISRDLISTAIVLIKIPSENNRILEAVYFRFAFPPNATASGSSLYSDSKSISLVDQLEQEFRNTLFKLAISSSSSSSEPELPPDATFSIVFETKSLPSDLNRCDSAFQDAAVSGKWYVESDLMTDQKVCN
jgi:mitotic spindle assembly checkpoint protein MAD2B